VGWHGKRGRGGSTGAETPWAMLLAAAMAPAKGGAHLALKPSLTSAHPSTRMSEGRALWRGGGREGGRVLG
jgi:hypothetical protein